MASNLDTILNLIELNRERPRQQIQPQGQIGNDVTNSGISEEFLNALLEQGINPETLQGLWNKDNREVKAAENTLDDAELQNLLQQSLGMSSRRRTIRYCRCSY